MVDIENLYHIQWSTMTILKKERSYILKRLEATRDHKDTNMSVI